MIPPGTKDCKKNVRKAIVCIEKSWYTVARIAVEMPLIFSDERLCCHFGKKVGDNSEEFRKQKGWRLMNSEDRKKFRKQKHRIMMMRLWMPVVLVVLLVVGLTAGGIMLSLGQTKNVAEQGTKEVTNESKGSDQENETGENQSEAVTGENEQPGSEAGTGENAEPQTGAENAESQNGSEAQADDGDYATEQADFDEFITNLNEAVTTNSNYLKSGSENLTITLAELQTYDRSHLTETQAKTYDALLDSLNVEMEGEQYDSVASTATGVALCTVDGGVDYFSYLLEKYSGVDGTWGDFRTILADEANGNFQTMNNLLGADGTLQVGAASFTKQGPDDAYAYDTVTAYSSALKKNLVCNGFVNGWNEFGIIRAYLNDDRLDDALKQYLIASTRMTYALYGVADISVHAGGWGEAEVTELCSQYFGEAGGASYGSNVYQMVIQNPGRYAAAAIDYLQITEIEATMAAQQGENYSEANLLDLLFNQGPANFRVMRSWVGL